MGYEYEITFPDEFSDWDKLRETLSGADHFDEFRFNDRYIFRLTDNRSPEWPEDASVKISEGCLLVEEVTASATKIHFANDLFYLLKSKLKNIDIDIKQTNP